jgi:tripeptide aminopeptidase
MVNSGRILDQLLRLIRVGSPSRREGRVASLVCDELAALGLQAAVDSANRGFDGEIGNVMCRLPGQAGLPPLMLNAHLDTVEPGDGIEPEVLDGVVRSRGDTVLGADDKAGVAAILEALRVLRERGLPHPPLEIVFTVAEEAGLLGARHLDCASLAARVGFSLDSSGPVGGIVVRAPGEEKITATIKGRAAHAGLEPEKGISAIAIAAKAVAGMRLGRLDEDTTANIGTIHGGTAINIVPERVVLEGEARSHDPARLRAQVNHMVERLRAEARAAGGEAEVQIEVLYERFALAEGDLPVAIARSAAQEMGLEVALKSSGGGSDANIFNAHGIATAVLAVGHDRVHTSDEIMPVAELERLAEWTVRLVTRAAEMMAPA